MAPREPLRCQNAACPARDSLSLAFVADEYSNALGGTIEAYRCAVCGQVVARCQVGRDRRWVRDLGPLWRQSLSAMWADPSFSINEIARQLESSADCVTKQAIKLGLPQRRRQKPGSNQAFKSTLKNRGTKHELDLREKRDRWNVLRKEHPELGRRAIRMRGPAVYAWLSRYDKGWLLENLPPRRRRTVAISAEEWLNRDRKTAVAIEKAAAEFRKKHGPGKSLSPTALAKAVGFGGALLTSFDRLPRARCTMIAMADTSVGFAIRHLTRCAVAVMIRVAREPQEVFSKRLCSVKILAGNLTAGSLDQYFWPGLELASILGRRGFEGNGFSSIEEFTGAAVEG